MDDQQYHVDDQQHPQANAYDDASKSWSQPKEEHFGADTPDRMASSTDNPDSMDSMPPQDSMQDDMQQDGEQQEDASMPSNPSYASSDTPADPSTDMASNSTDAMPEDVQRDQSLAQDPQGSADQWSPSQHIDPDPALSAQPSSESDEQQPDPSSDSRNNQSQQTY